MATTHTVFGKFLNYYRALKKAGQLDSTPILLSEGDSWFSTPLYYNLVDWLEVGSPSGAFLRLEKSGDLALKMFTGSNLRKLESRLRNIRFDVLMVSAGGNDFVDEFLQETFADVGRLSVEQALQHVIHSGRFGDVKDAIEGLIKTATAARPTIRILMHSYDYPLRMGVPAQLNVEQIGLVALFKRRVGDWIARHIDHVLPAPADQIAFAKGLMDHFHDDVLVPLRNAYQDNFYFVDLRGTLTQEADWNDEMHPTGDAFRRLAEPFRDALRELLPPNKRAALG